MARSPVPSSREPREASALRSRRRSRHVATRSRSRTSTRRRRATACAKLAERGLSARAAGLDVTDAVQVHEVLREADRATPLTTVVCNAGLGFAGAIVDTAPEEFDRVMAVNVRGVFFTMQAALQVMAPRGHGNIVSISSTSGFQSSSVPMAVYDISKAAVRMLTMSAGRESAAAGIRVNAVAPGTVGTDLVKEVLSAEAIERLEQRAHPARPARDARTRSPRRSSSSRPTRRRTSRATRSSPTAAG